MNDMKTETKQHESCEIEVLTFTCPHCGGHRIEEFVMMERNIGWIAVPGDPNYDWSEDDNRNVSIGRTGISSETGRNHYRCSRCGAPLLDKEGNAFWGFPLLLEWLRQKRDEEAMEQPRSKMFRFTCPNCGEHDLREIVTGMVEDCGVKGVFDDGEIAWGRYRTVDDDEEVQFQCDHCGYELDDDDDLISDGKALAKWLLGHCRDHADDAGEKDHHEREG